VANVTDPESSIMKTRHRGASVEPVFGQIKDR